MVTACFAGTFVLWMLLELQTPYLNGPHEWHWDYTSYPSFWFQWLKAIVRLAPWAIGLGALAWRIAPRVKGGLRTAVGLAGLIVWGMIYCWISIGASGPFGVTHLGRTVQNPDANGYFHVANRLDHPQKINLLSLYPDYMPAMPLHAGTHPPGATAVCRAIIVLYDHSPALVKITQAGMSLFKLRVQDLEGPLPRKMAAMAIGNLLLLCGLLTALPLFALVRDGMGGGTVGNRAAWATAIFWVHYPNLIVFTPEFDQVFPFLAFSIAWMLLRGMSAASRARTILWGGLAGAIFIAGVLLSFTFLVWAPLFGLMLLLECFRRANTWRIIDAATELQRAFWLASSAVIAGMFILAALRFTLKLELVPIFFKAYQVNQAFRWRAGRTYLTWLFFSPWDVLLFAGPALLIPALVAGYRGVVSVWKRPNRIMSAWVLGPAGMIAMTISGLMPGENARLYLMFVPSIAWAGGVWLALYSRKRFWPILALILLGQFIFLYILRTTMKYIGV